MHPTLALGPVALSSWAALALLGCIVGVAAGVGGLRARERASRIAALGAANLVELVLVVVLAGFLFAKVGHVVFEAHGHVLPDGRTATSAWTLLAADPWHWARLTEPGFVQLAGVIGAVVVGLLYLRRQGLWARVATVADGAALGVACGVAVGRLGCLLAGCCYGRATDVAWAVTYPPSHVTRAVSVHPTQLYDSAAALLAAGCFVALGRTALAPGQRALTVAALLSVARVITEALRGDARGALGPLSTSQVIGGAIAMAALTALAWRARRPSTEH